MTDVRAKNTSTIVILIPIRGKIIRRFDPDTAFFFLPLFQPFRPFSLEIDRIFGAFGASIREKEEEEEEVNENYRARVIFCPGKRGGGRKFFEGKRKKKKKTRGTLTRLYSKLISSPPFVLTLLTFHLFDFVEALQPSDTLPSFFGSSAFARPALHFQVAISLYRSLSLSLPLLSSRIRRYGG